MNFTTKEKNKLNIFVYSKLDNSEKLKKNEEKIK